MYTSRDEDERDFYWSLLNLGQAPDPAALLQEALHLILRVVDARRGYLEIRDPIRERSWSSASALDAEAIDAVRRTVSMGIVREAIDQGRTVQTASAVTDPRFSKRESVQKHQIEAAVCAPVGLDRPVGVVYLQGRADPGPFSERDVASIELFARHLAPYADRMIRMEADALDPTEPWRRRLACSELIGQSAALAGMLREIALVAPLDLAVLLSGPTGSGKTAVARVIHRSSPRASAPFVELNCAAIPTELLESELFGAERGAHSTATQRVVGKVESARDGTLFLDEVAELSPAAQAKLLQLLQSGQYYSLGSPTPRRSAARVLAATNQDLEEAVATKAFRADLYYRLNVFTVRVPGLDARPEDTPLLARHFLQQAIERHGLPSLYLSPAARHALQAAEFPGNIRELANIVERAAVLASGEATFQVSPEHLFPSQGRAEGGQPPQTYAEHLAAFQRALLEATLDEERGNVSAAARRLDITRSHFYNLMTLHGVRPRR